MLAEENAVGMTLSLTDRFDDYGLVGVALCVKQPSGDFHLDSFLMSCRVINRTAEQFFMKELAAQLQSVGAGATLTATYIPTPKNAMVAGALEACFVEGQGSREDDYLREAVECARRALWPREPAATLALERPDHPEDRR